MDQESYIVYQDQWNPFTRAVNGSPLFDDKHILVDLFGVRDAWGAQRTYPEVVVRPFSAESEEAPDLRNPKFSSCTLPVVLYSSYGNFFSEQLMRSFVVLSLMAHFGVLNRYVTLVVPNLGMKLYQYIYFLNQPFSVYNVTTLSHLSSRLPYDTPEGYSYERKHVRCFEQLLLCHVKPKLMRHKFYPQPLWVSSQRLVQYYEPVLSRVPHSFALNTTLHVLIIDRDDAVVPGRGVVDARRILNLRQVLHWCKHYRPAQGSRYVKTACVLHFFGRDLMQDLALCKQTDVMIGIHGSGLFNAFFMPYHSSLIEVRPYGFQGYWSNMYMRNLSRHVDLDSIFWWGINVVNPDHYRPSMFERAGIGTAVTYIRDRHTFINVTVLNVLMDHIVWVDKDRDRYEAVRQSHLTHLRDNGSAIVNFWER